MKWIQWNIKKFHLDSNGNFIIFFWYISIWIKALKIFLTSNIRKILTLLTWRRRNRKLFNRKNMNKKFQWRRLVFFFVCWWWWGHLEKLLLLSYLSQVLLDSWVSSYSRETSNSVNSRKILPRKFGKANSQSPASNFQWIFNNLIFFYYKELGGELRTAPLLY